MASQNMDPAIAIAAEKDKISSSSKTNDTNLTKRLNRELMLVMTSGIKGISAFPVGDSLFSWIGTIDGAKGTVYENLRYKLSFEFPRSYPYTAPTVKFVTPIYHPNVDEHGNICLDILKENWVASLEVRTILLSIQSLLGEPNNASPLNVQAAEMWDNQELFKATLLKHYKEKVEQTKQ